MTTISMKIPILVKYKHRKSIKWIPLTDDSMCLPRYKEWVLWRKEKETTFWTVQAADLQNRLRTCPTPMPVCKTESIPDQWTALTRAYKTLWCFILQGTNTLSISLSFYQVTNIPSEAGCYQKRSVLIRDEMSLFLLSYCVLQQRTQTIF